MEGIKKWQPWFTVEGLPVSVGKKVDGLVDLLNSDVIDMGRLRRHLSAGIPDEAPQIREYCWKLVLGYLPEERRLWAPKIKQTNETYESFIKLFLPSAKFPQYPLILKKGHPRYEQLQRDFILWEQIEKDTTRTHAEFSFFSRQSAEIMIPFLTSARREKFKQIHGESEEPYRQFLDEKEKQRKTYRYDYMTRILYIYSKLNPCIQYVQGMNEILAPIFYLVNSARAANNIEQSSCFFMFNSAISDIIELHIKDLDKSENGIHGKLQQVNNMLVVIEPRIWSRLELLKIDPFFYCFRWITLLYAQDFALFDTLRIWESIFSSDSRIDYINYFAISIIIFAKKIILNSQFTTILEYLQNIKDFIQVDWVINQANALREKFKEYDFKSGAKESKEIINITTQQQGVETNKKKKGFIHSINKFIDKIKQ